MNLKAISLVLFSAALLACPEAIVGKAGIEEINTVVIEGEGYMQNLGQDLLPGSTELRFAISDHEVRADLTAGRSRTTMTRTPEFN